MKEPDTRERILDAAEHLFAHQGYHNTSLREITGKARANLAAVNYHFGSKENLIEAVIQHRFIPLNQNRLEQLKKIKAAAQVENRRPQVKDIMRAFIEPTIRFLESGPGSQDFLTIIARAHTDPDGTIRNLFSQMVGPMFQEFFETLCEALPNLSRGIVFDRFLFAIGAMSQALMRLQNFELLPNMPEGVSQRSDSQTMTEELLAFVSRGMEGP